jgi:hypothetical protein
MDYQKLTQNRGLKTGLGITAVMALLAVLLLPFGVLWGFNYWLTGSNSLGFLFATIFTLILLVSLTGSGISLWGEEEAKGQKFVESLKSNTALKAALSLICYLMLIRIWWARAVPEVTASFASPDYWVGILVASLVLVLATVAIGAFLVKGRSGSGNKAPLWGMVAVALIATLLAFTSDRDRIKYFDPFSDSPSEKVALAKYCPNEQCPDVGSSHIFVKEEYKYVSCPHCGTSLKDVGSEQVKAHLEAVQESKDRVSAPFRALAHGATRLVTSRRRREPPRRAEAAPITPPYDVPKNLEQLIRQKAKEHDLSPELLGAIAWVESTFETQAVSKKGAQGLMQLMPRTQRSYGITNPFNAEQSLDGAGYFLTHLMTVYRGKIEHVLAAYHAGEDDVNPLRDTKWKDIVANKRLSQDVIDYVAEVRGRVDRLATEGFPVNYYETVAFHWPAVFRYPPKAEKTYTLTAGADYLDTGLVPGNQYYFEIFAKDPKDFDLSHVWVQTGEDGPEVKIKPRRNHEGKQMGVTVVRHNFYNQPYRLKVDHGGPVDITVMMYGPA